MECLLNRALWNHTSIPSANTYLRYSNSTKYFPDRFVCVDEWRPSTRHSKKSALKWIAHQINNFVIMSSQWLISIFVKPYNKSYIGIYLQIHELFKFSTSWCFIIKECDKEIKILSSLIIFWISLQLWVENMPGEIITINPKFVFL